MQYSRKTKATILIGVILYFIAIFGLIFLVKTPSIIYLVLLPIGLTLLANQEIIETSLKGVISNNFGQNFKYISYFLLLVFALCFIGFTILPLINGTDTLSTIFTVFLVLGLFLLNGKMKE